MTAYYKAEKPWATGGFHLPSGGAADIVGCICGGMRRMRRRSVWTREESVTIEEYIGFFDAKIGAYLPARRASEVRSVLEGGDPKVIFMTLERVVEKEELQDSDFEERLTDFYWQFCS